MSQVGFGRGLCQRAEWPGACSETLSVIASHRRTRPPNPRRRLQHRPLNATSESPRLLVSMCPIPGVRFSAVWRFSDYVTRLELDTDKYPSLTESRAVSMRCQRMENEEMVAKILVDRPHASRYEIMEATGLSEWAVQTAMERLGYRVGGDSSKYYSRRPSSSVTSDAELVLSQTPEAVRQIADVIQLSVKAIEKRRRAAQGVLDKLDEGADIDPRTLRSLEETAITASLLAVDDDPESASAEREGVIRGTIPFLCRSRKQPACERRVYAGRQPAGPSGRGRGDLPQGPEAHPSLPAPVQYTNPRSGRGIGIRSGPALVEALPGRGGVVRSTRGCLHEGVRHRVRGAALLGVPGGRRRRL